jgi:hypothetical protein
MHLPTRPAPIHPRSPARSSPPRHRPHRHHPHRRLGSRQASASCSPGLIWWSQLRAACGPAAQISRRCCAWSRPPRTALNRSTHAAEARRRNPRASAEYPQTRLAELVAALVADVVGRRQACRRSGGCQARPSGDVDHRRGAVVPLSQAGDTPRNLPPVRPDSFNAAGAGDQVDAAGHGIQLRRPESVAQIPRIGSRNLRNPWLLPMPASRPLPQVGFGDTFAE